MKVIFIKDAPKIGKRDEVKDINDGYVRNFLLPQKLVEIATPEALAKLNKKLGDRKAGQTAEDIRNKLLIDSIDTKEITIKAKANEKDALFKSITPKDIINSIKTELKITAPESIIDSNLHLKSIGVHDLVIKLGNHKGLIKLNIVKE
jgi:large subunit ribosomal protein L9